MTEADLSGADLSGADLRDAFLTRAKFVFADLRGAKLQGSHLAGADLSGADLSGATLGDVSRAQYSQDTKWPTGFQPTGASLVEHGEKTALEQANISPHNTHEFNITFSPNLSPGQVKSTLEALSAYYRSCGGAGLRIDLDALAVIIPEPSYAER